MDTVKEALRTWATPAITLGLITLLVAPMYGKFTEINTRLDATRMELKDEINAVRTELKGDISQLGNRLDTTRTELKGEINAVRMELKGEIHALGARLDSTRDGLDRRMQATTARVDALNIRVDAVERGDTPKGDQGNATPEQGPSPQ